MAASEYTPIDIGGFIVDASIEESHGFDSEITSFPVESGGVISDHVRLLPLALQLECIVSDTPIGAKIEAVRASTGSLDTANVKSWSDRAHEHFKTLRDKREPFDVVTSLQTYKSMIIERYSPMRRVGDGHSLRFSLSLRSLNIVTNDRTFVKTATPDSQKKQKLGPRPVKVPPEDKNATPVLYDAYVKANAESNARKQRSNTPSDDVPVSWLAEIFQ